MRYTEDEITEFSNVGYGKKATARLASGLNLKEIIVHTKNVDADQMTRALLKVGSKTPYNLSGATIAAIQEYKGETVDAKVWVISFLDTSAKTVEGQEKTSLQTLMGENVILQLDLGERKSPAQDALEPEILGVIVSGEPVLVQGRPFREFMPQSLETLIPIGKTGKNTFTDFDIQENHLLRRMFFKSTDITDIEIEVRGMPRKKVSVAHMHYQIKRTGKKIPNGLTVFDPMYLGFNWADMLNITGKFKIILHTTSASDIEVDVETMQAVHQSG